MLYFLLVCRLFVHSEQVNVYFFIHDDTIRSSVCFDGFARGAACYLTCGLIYYIVVWIRLFPGWHHIEAGTCQTSNFNADPMPTTPQNSPSSLGTGVNSGAEDSKHPTRVLSLAG